MRIAVVADFVAGSYHGAGDLRQAPHIQSALEKRGPRAIPFEKFEDLRREFARPVVEGEADGTATARSVPD